MAGSMEDFDLVVIGFGKAGKTVAMKRAKAGDRVALVERDPMMYGGTCINVGCVPTKTLLTDMARFELGGDDGSKAFKRAVGGNQNFRPFKERGSHSRKTQGSCGKRRTSQDRTTSC